MSIQEKGNAGYKSPDFDLNAYANRITFINDTLRDCPQKVYTKGRILVMTSSNKGRRVTHEIMHKLPTAFYPYDTAIGTIILIRETLNEIGKYDKGTIGFQAEHELNFVDINTKCIYYRIKYIGDLPPSSFEYKTKLTKDVPPNSITGRVHYDKMISFILNAPHIP